MPSQSAEASRRRSVRQTKQIGATTLPAGARSLGDLPVLPFKQAIQPPPAQPPLVQPPPIQPPPIQPPPIQPPLVQPSLVQPPAVQPPVAQPPIAQPPLVQPSLNLTLERCAAISAELGDRRTPRADVLRQNNLTESTWAASERHWTNTLAKEAELGEKELLQAFDAAYVAALEKLRGPIRLEDYARLTVASERGSLRAVLEELTIQRSALMRIERVWAKRLAEDPSLLRKTAEAVEAERKR
jgi:hypothetical protein